MRLFFFNLDMDSPSAREIHSVIPAVIFSESPVIYASTHGTVALLMENDFIDRHPKILFNFYKSFFALQHGEAKVNHLVDMVTEGLKLEHKKMRTKADFIFLAKCRNMLKTIKESVFTYLKFSAELYYLEKINPYVRSKEITLSSFSRNNDQEDITSDERNTENLIHILTDAHEYFFCTEFAAVNAPVSDIGNDVFPEDFLLRGMFKTDILNLPGCVMLKQGKLGLLHEELQPALKEFQHGIDKLQDDVKELAFAPENFPVMRQKINASLTGVFTSLSKKCEDSIYLNQLSNNEWGEYASVLSLAIASRHSLVDVLKRTGQINGKVFENLISDFRNNNLLDKTVLFFIHTVPEYPPKKEKIAHEEIEQLWKQSYET
ncbi:MAG: hypothetical protein ABI855_07580 [Bacteroidota bacterium]